MREQIVSLPYPHSGLNEVLASTDKLSSFSFDEQNMRSMNPRTGTLTGAQRAGSVRATSAVPTTTGPVRALTSLVWDSRKVTYNEIIPVAPGDVLFGVVTPNKAEVIAAVADAQSNVYIIENNTSLCKYNSDGELIWRIPLPTKEEGQACRALAVEDGTNNVYVGTSAGTNERNSRLWAYRQLEDDKTERIWELENVGFVEKLSIRDGVLHTLQNFPSLAVSKIVVYVSLQASSPDIDWTANAAYPANDMFVRPNDGSIYVASPANTLRGIDPRYPDFTQRTVDWTPRDLPGFDDRVFSWYDATQIVGLAENDPIDFLEDISGGDRHLFQGTAVARPLYNLRGVGGLPSVRFDNRSNPLQQFSEVQSLQSGPNPALGSLYLDQFKTTLPSAQTASGESERFAFFFLCRVSTDTAEVVSVPFSQSGILGLGGVPTEGIEIYLNGRNDGTTTPFVGDASFVTLTNVLSPGGGALYALHTRQPLHGNYGANNLTGLCLLTIILNGNQDPTGDGKQQGLFRVNGKPIDRFSAFFIGKIGSLLGRVDRGLFKTVANSMTGDFCESLCLRQYTAGGNHGNPVTGAFNSTVGSHYPRTLGTTGGGATSTAVAWMATTVNSFNDLEIERIEGYLMHKWGGSALLPSGAATATTINPYAPGNYPHPYSTNAVYAFGPPRKSGGITKESLPWLLHSKNPILAKYGPNKGELKWVVTRRLAQNYAGSALTIPAATTDDIGGIGFAVACDDTDGVFSVGAIIGTTPDTEQAACVRRIVDKGDTYSIAAVDGAWFFTSKVNAGAETLGLGLSTVTRSHNYIYPRLGVDQYGNLHMPWSEIVDNDAATYAFIAKNGIKRFAFNIDGTNNCPQGRVAVPTTVSANLVGAIQTRVESVFLGTNLGRGLTSQKTPTFYNVRQLTQTHTGGPSRFVTRLQVVDGTIRKITPTTLDLPAGTGTIATPHFGTTVPFISSTTFNQQMFFTDGINYRVYDARLDTVTEYKAKNSGKIPGRCKFIATWHGRIVLARSADEPQNWFMSEASQPYHWDFFPGVVTSTSAAFGSQTLAGLCPDIINTLIPYNDDLILFGCDHSIWRLTGDPMRGGQWDLVSDITGIAFGRSWTKDESGTLYFFGSRGGVWSMAPGGQPVPMTRISIENRLSNVDLNTNRVELLWNSEDDGLHVFVFQDTTTTRMTHFFWERKTNAWHPDYFGSQSIEPSSAYVYDGDLPEDRTLWLGGADGNARRWDRTAQTDDGVAIDSFVTMFPIEPHGGGEYRFRGLNTVLASGEQGGCNYEAFASDSPDSPGDPVCNGVLVPGRNERQPFLARGAYIGLRLRNSGKTSWGYGVASVRAILAGREQLR